MIALPERYVRPAIEADLADRKMVFVSGPRQVGKTTLRKAWFAVECKTGEKAPSPSLRYVRERSDIGEFYQVHLGTRDYGDAQTSVRVMPFATFCRELALP